MRLTVFSIALLAFQFCKAQLNISAEFHYAKEQQYTQLSCIKNRKMLCYGLQLGYGNFGTKTCEHGVFSVFNVPYEKPFGDLPMFYDIKSYTMHNVGLSMGASIGIQLNMNEKHHFFILFPLHFYLVTDHFSYRYNDPDTGIETEAKRKFKHTDVSISFACKYQYDISPKFGISIGTNLPHFISYSHPFNFIHSRENPMEGLRSPTYSLGITYYFKTNEL